VSQRIVAIRFEDGERIEAGRVLVELQNAEARASIGRINYVFGNVR
jgi:multidrug efflux pump subunit AcrA (membrane-fusion protein)